MVILISIIIPMYNCERQLSRCIESVQNQKEKNLEILLIDDGSTDQTLAIAQKYESEDERITVFSQSNRGVSYARNLGLKFARGEYIMFVDADDYIELDMVSSFNIEIKKGYDMVISNICADRIYTHDENLLNYFWETYRIDSKKLDKVISEYLSGDLKEQIAYSVCNKIFKKKLLVKNNIFFNNDIKIGEDMIFVLSYMLLCKNIKFINKNYYHYCIEDGSAMNNDTTDYSLAYDETLVALMNNIGSYSSNINVKNAIHSWSLETFIVIINSKKVLTMNWKDFKMYFTKTLLISDIYYKAIHCSRAQNIKRKLLRKAMSMNSPQLVYLLILFNKFLYRSRFNFYGQ